MQFEHNQVQYQQVFVPVQQVQQARSVVTRPLTIDQKIKKVEEDVKYEKKRIWGISTVFVALGAIGFFSGINLTFKNREVANFVRDTKQSPWNNPNVTNWTIMNATEAVPDRIELGIFDFLRAIDVCKSVLGALVFMMGLSGLATIKRGKAMAATKNFQRVFYTMCVFLIFFVYMRKQEASFNWVINALKSGQLNATNWDDIIVNGQHIKKVEVEEPTKRLLAAQDPFKKVGKTSDQCKADHSTKDDCDSDDACTWCACMAVPSACWSVEDAKRLPAAVYVCDKKAQEILKDDPPAPPAEPTWPEMQPLHPMMLFLTLGSVYLVTFLKFIEKSYAKIEFLKGAKKLVKYQGKKPVTAAPEPTQSFDYSMEEVEEEETASKNDMC